MLPWPPSWPPSLLPSALSLSEAVAPLPPPPVHLRAHAALPQVVWQDHPALQLQGLDSQGEEPQGELGQGAGVEQEQGAEMELG